MKTIRSNTRKLFRVLNSSVQKDNNLNADSESVIAHTRQISCRVWRILALVTTCALFVLDLLEEVVPFIIYQNKRREIFYFNLPDSFHS